MNGATADPCVNTIKDPNRSSTTRIGNSQNFFRSFINDHNSRINSPIVIPPLMNKRWPSRSIVSMLAGRQQGLCASGILVNRSFPQGLLNNRKETSRKRGIPYWGIMGTGHEPLLSVHLPSAGCRVHIPKAGIMQDHFQIGARVLYILRLQDDNN